jgi:hypothetical protein
MRTASGNYRPQSSSGRASSVGFRQARKMVDDEVNNAEVSDPGQEPDSHGLLIMRAWVEPNSSEPIRVQIRLTSDISSGMQRTVNLARVDDVCAVVREWLATVLNATEQS